MPLPTVRQPAMPTESYELPAVARSMFCKAKKFPFESVNFCCAKGEVALDPVIIPDDPPLYSILKIIHVICAQQA